MEIAKAISRDLKHKANTPFTDHPLYGPGVL